ncbi:MAG TPA: hypothetical protein VJ201_03155, partial [Candidatus Babeliales bacterium]|nr:hypothetical protein [Candidatus Babeliales bacterium]
VSNKFVLDGILWFKFDPSVVSFEVINKFSFEKGMILQKSDPVIKNVDGILFVRYAIRIEFFSELNHRLFPLTDHRIFFILSNQSSSPKDLIFKSSTQAFNISERLQPRGWQPKDLKTQSGYILSRLNPALEFDDVAYPVLLFEVDFTKPGLRKVMLVIIPIFLIFLLGLFSLVLDPIMHGAPIISLSLGSIIGLLTYGFVIAQLSPEVGYFTLTDYLYTFVLVAIFLCFLLNLYSVVRASRSHYVRVLKDSAFLCIQVGGLMVWYYLLYFWGT